MDNRKAFFEELIKLAEKDNRIVLIVCDVGFSFTEEFQKRFPSQYFNFGVTEQSSMLIASAMALSGLKPYIYSMINFMLFRPYEMVRNGVVKHNANVKIIGVKGSEKYKFLGFSHNLLHEQEDIVACQNIGLKWYIPVSSVDKVVEITYRNEQPAYIRL
jgi:transketolase